MLIIFELLLPPLPTFVTGPRAAQKAFTGHPRT